MFEILILTHLNPKDKTPSGQWTFAQEACIRVGRAADNQVIILDALVSRYHLELHRVNPSTNSPTSSSSSIWRLISQGTNGTFINGILTQQSFLTADTVLELAKGGPLLQFQIVRQREITRSQVFACSHAGNPPQNLFCISCGYPTTVERTVRQYQILRTLGQGGMGTTLLAWDPEQNQVKPSGQPIAPTLAVIKEMNTDMAQIAKAQELFEREARTLKSLNHPGVPRFYDFFLEQGKKYLVMEMIHGQDLEKLIYQKGPVPPRQAVEWMVQTGEVLHYLHGQNPAIVHRDIKPANLLLRQRDRRIIVIDFGAVKEIGTPLGTRIGAEGYSAPEQDRGQPVTQSDIYAVGATLIFLVTGESPVSFYSKQAQGYGFDLDRILTLPPKLRQVVEQATAYRVQDRIQTIQALAKALEQCRD
ncbi:MAG: protein kinase [Oscillatoriales cyanobacterium SM2_3_0]|nr:protein kinase [Oscillatoriales cyanobacterium SM2_3_0]